MTIYHLDIKDNKKGKIIKSQKLLIQIPIRELQNSLIKPPSESVFSGARLESDEVITGDTLLRKYVTPQF